MGAGRGIDSIMALSLYTRLRLDRENFSSYKIFECIACRFPVVCSYEQGGSNIRYVGDYNLGVIVPSEGADTFTNAILRVLADGTYFTEDFVKRARHTLQELDVTWDALVGQVESLCGSAVNSSSRHVR